VQQEPQSGLGQAVQALRMEAEIERAALAERSDLPESLIVEIESGKADPVWGDVRRLAVALGVSLERLSEMAEEFEDD
jgi:transcriptional regulator with XRE-family HTH domain